MEVNGKFYSMWGQFVEKQSEFVGGNLHDQGDSVDRSIGGVSPYSTTKITGIILRPNGKDSAWFEITGEKFSCGSDVRYLGITNGEEGWLTFSGFGGHIFRIQKPNL